MKLKNGNAKIDYMEIADICDQIESAISAKFGIQVDFEEAQLTISELMFRAPIDKKHFGIISEQIEDAKIIARKILVPEIEPIVNVWVSIHTVNDDLYEFIIGNVE